MVRGGNHEATKALSWVHPLCNRRVVFSNELTTKPGQPVDGKLIDIVASGGDEITYRQNFKDETSMVNQSTLFLFVNDVPCIAPLKDSTLSRLVLIPFLYSFVDDPHAANEKHRDPEFKAKLHQDHRYRDAFIHVLLDEAQRWFKWKQENPDLAEMPLPKACTDFKEEMLEPKTSRDISKIFLEYFDVTGNTNHRYPSSDMSRMLSRIYKDNLTKAEKSLLYKMHKIEEKNVRQVGAGVVKHRCGLKIKLDKEDELNRPF